MKEQKRLARTLDARKAFYARCARLAFCRLGEAHAGWLRAICENGEPIRRAVLHGFVEALAREMAEAETYLKRQRGRPAKWEETAVLELEKQDGRTLPQAIQSLHKHEKKQERTPTRAEVARKAAAVRQRRYRKRITKKH